MKSNKNCILTPEVKPGVPSLLYKGLLNNKNLYNDRQLVNYIYVEYVASDAPEKMDSLGFTRDKNGQHSAKDVLKFFDINKMLYERNETTRQEVLAGVRDNAGNLIAYDNGSAAINQAIDYNKNSKGLVATVYKNGNKYYVKLNMISTNAFKIKGELETQEKLYNTTKQAFNAVGINFDSVISTSPELYNITQPHSFASYLKSLANTRNALLGKGELKFLLSSLEGSEMNRLKSLWGDLDTIVDNIYNGYRNTSTLTSGQLMLIENALNKAKKFNGLDLNALQTQLFNESMDIEESSENFNKYNVFDELNKKYELENNRLIIIGDKLDYLSQIAGRSVVNLNRRLKALKSKGADLNTRQDLSRAIQDIVSEIDRKRYYAALLTYLKEVKSDYMAIADAVNKVEGLPGSMEHAQNAARLWTQFNDAYQQHEEVLKALTLLDSKIIDEDISTEDKQTIKALASELFSQFNEQKGQLDKFQKDTMYEIVTNVIGEEDVNGVSVSILLDHLNEDASFQDRMLYAFGKQSNTLVSIMGKLTKDAQDERRLIQMQIQARIDRADSALKKAGISNTEWMYETDGKGNYHIISEYDWDAYYKARNEARKQLLKSGIKGYNLMLKLKEWEQENTEEIVVSNASGRTERVPNSLYRNPFKMEKINNNPALKAYYEAALEIKGEIEDMLPDYARSLYRPPQIRRDLLDAHGIRDYFKSVGNKIRNIWVKEGDFDYMSNATLPEDSYFTDGNYKNDVKKSIPVFYFKHLENQNELLMDFSSALGHLSGTAANYECLENVLDTVTMMQDYISNMRVVSKNWRGQTKAETLSSMETTLIQKLFNNGQSNLQYIMDGFIDMHYYGVKLKDQGWKSKVGGMLHAYTSMRGLSTNVLGAVSNELVGEAQIFIEAAGGKYFSMKSLLKADAIMFGYGTVGAIGEFCDYMTNNNNSMATLLKNRFDPNQEKFDELTQKRYHKSIVRHLLDVDPTFKLYGIGEQLIHDKVMFAVLYEEQVLMNGKKVSLIDALDKSEKIDGGRDLIVKPNVTTLDGRPLTSIFDKYFNEVTDEIRKANQDCHGAMNQEDKGLISRRMWGRMLIQMRQWMVEHFSRRYRGTHYDATEDGWTEGWWATAMKFIAQYDEDLGKTTTAARLKFSTLNSIIAEYEREKENRTLEDSAFRSLELKAKFARTQIANIRKLGAELALTSLLCTLSWGVIGAAKDLDEDFWTRFLAYQLKRLAWDEFTTATPIGVVLNVYGLVQSPFPAISTVKGLLYPVWGLGDIDDTLKSGPNKGENKYWRNVKKYTFPVYKDIQNLINLGKSVSAFEPFDPNAQVTR